MHVDVARYIDVQLTILYGRCCAAESSAVRVTAVNDHDLGVGATQNPQVTIESNRPEVQGIFVLGY